VLASDHRLHRAADFRDVMRRGRRGARPLLTVHALLASDGGGRPARAGLVVSKAVGGSVVRHRTSRRLRHLLAPHLAALPEGARIVVRAAPAAGSATSTQLGGDLGSALTAALRPRR